MPSERPFPKAARVKTCSPQARKRAKTKALQEKGHQPLRGGLGVSLGAVQLPRARGALGRDAYGRYPASVSAVWKCSKTNALHANLPPREGPLTSEGRIRCAPESCVRSFSGHRAVVRRAVMHMSAAPGWRRRGSIKLEAREARKVLR
jgi:hypothetical protein